MSPYINQFPDLRTLNPIHTFPAIKEYELDI